MEFMNKFESVLLISPEVSINSRDSIINNFKKLVADLSGKIIDSEDWGLRDLSYKIQNLSKATALLPTINLSPNQKNIGERRRKKISHEDSIILDKFCLENEMAPPMIAVHQMIIDNFRSSLDPSRSIEQSISTISFRFAEVVNRVEASLDPSSEKGIEFSDTEIKHIHQSIKELEEQLKIFKSIIAK